MITCISAGPAEQRRKKWLNKIRKRLFDNIDKYLIPDLSNIVIDYLVAE